jgi:hypothetical protein
MDMTALGINNPNSNYNRSLRTAHVDVPPTRRPLSADFQAILDAAKREVSLFHQQKKDDPIRELLESLKQATDVEYPPALRDATRETLLKKAKKNAGQVAAHPAGS